jgi:precorrin-8X/cobalt-precorrin-8 methylmutase
MAIVEQVGERVADRGRILPAVVGGAGPGVDEQVARLAGSGIRRLEIVPAPAWPDAELMAALTEAVTRCQPLYPRVDLVLQSVDPDGRAFEDLLVDRVWPLFAGERDQPSTGAEIEKRSHAIIDRRLDSEPGLDTGTRAVMRRIIHAGADFSFATSLRFHPRAIERAVAALRQRRPVICDVHMVRQGFTKYDGPVLCAIDAGPVAAAAQTQGTTRAAAAIERLQAQLEGAIVAVGNAPTALWKVMELAQRPGGPQPAVVIGLPVGFVGALESKLALARSGLCYITNLSPRGGSPTAAAALNALALLAATSDQA